jgi:hypothetical protein
MSKNSNNRNKFSKTWKTQAWQIKSFSQDFLWYLTKELIFMAMPEKVIEKSEIQLYTNLRIEIKADSMQILKMLLAFEYMLQKVLGEGGIAIPHDSKLRVRATIEDIVLIEDLFDVLFQSVLEYENQTAEG